MEFIDAVKIFECHDAKRLEDKINAFLEKHECKIKILKREVVLSAANRISVMLSYQHAKSEVSERLLVLSADNIDDMTDKKINLRIKEQKLKVVDVLLDCHNHGQANLMVDVAMIFYIK